MSLYKRCRPQIAEVFSIFGLPDDTIDDLQRSVDVTQAWVSGDHSDQTTESLSKYEFEPAQSDRLHQLYDELGMNQEYRFAPGHLDQIVVLGGLAVGNDRRMQFLKDTLQHGDVTTDRIMLLGGQRRMLQNETEDLENTFQQIKLNGTADKWSELMQARSPDTYWETDMMRAAAVSKMGSLVVKQMHLKMYNEDPLLRYELDWQGTPVTLMHTHKVERKDGKPRHTTEACMADWIKTIPPYAARVGFIGANPHTERMGKTARRALQEGGGPDIELVIAGPASSKKLGHSFYFGELARSLYEDSKY